LFNWDPSEAPDLRTLPSRVPFNCDENTEDTRGNPWQKSCERNTRAAADVFLKRLARRKEPQRA
jgi:hypothetical protein